MHVHDEMMTTTMLMNILISIYGHLLASSKGQQQRATLTANLQHTLQYYKPDALNIELLAFSSYATESVMC